MLAAYAAASCCALLAPLDGPPVLNSPVFSLATLNDDGTTNMQILTYATPVGVAPRTWALSLYGPTRTHSNFKARRSGVLQLLTLDHAGLIWTLGGQSGGEIDKAAACAAAGFRWMDPASDMSDDEWAADGIQLLPGCACYLRLVQVEEDQLRACGEHDVAICTVEGAIGDPDLLPSAYSSALNTQVCRLMGLISDRGKAIEPPS